MKHNKLFKYISMFLIITLIVSTTTIGVNASNIKFLINTIDESEIPEAMNQVLYQRKSIQLV